MGGTRSVRSDMEPNKHWGDSHRLTTGKPKHSTKHKRTRRGKQDNKRKNRTRASGKNHTQRPNQRATKDDWSRWGTPKERKTMKQAGADGGRGTCTHCHAYWISSMIVVVLTPLPIASI